MTERLILTGVAWADLILCWLWRIIGVGVIVVGLIGVGVIVMVVVEYGLSKRDGDGNG